MIAKLVQCVGRTSPRWMNAFAVLLAVQSAGAQTPMLTLAQRANADGSFVEGLRSLRETPTATVAEWRRSLERVASRRGEGGVLVRRVILDAIESRSDADCDRLIRTLARSTHSIAAAEVLGSGRRSRPSARMDCTTVFDGISYVGECASAAEIDYPRSIIDGLEAEISG